MNGSVADRRVSVGAGVVAALAAAALVGAPTAAADDKARSKRPAPQRREVEVAIDGALKWLADRQVKLGDDKGCWDAPRYRTATASFAGLAMLANGHRPGKGRYGEVIDRAMRFVQESMDAEGYLGGKDNSMYVHAACALFGLSCLGRGEDARKEAALAKWCGKALALTVRAQKVRKGPAERGGWRYTPWARESDLSVTSWQLLLLQAARQCGYAVDEAVIRAAMRYVNSGFVDAADGTGGFVYRPGVSKEPEPAVTGVAVFLKALLEPEPDAKMARSLAYLRGFSPSWGGKQYKGYFFFGTFYMAQGMFQAGGPAWRDFAPRIQRILLDHQEGDGHWELPSGNVLQSRLAGKAYATAMGALILSVDKQYLPMYQRQRRLFGRQGGGSGQARGAGEARPRHKSAR